MHRGYVLIFRKIKDTFFYQDSEAVHLWVHLLLEANHKDKSFLFNGKKMDLKKGQLITGRKKLASSTGINESKVKRLLKMFSEEKLIDQQTTNKFSIISITNWEFHQAVDQQMASQWPASDQPVTTNNTLITTIEKTKKNKPKKQTYSDEYEKFWTDYQRRGSKIKGFAEWKKMSPEERAEAFETLPDYIKSLSDPKYQKHIEGWLKGKMWESDYSNRAGKIEEESPYAKLWEN
jgi:hemerythrin superfamily protein